MQPYCMIIGMHLQWNQTHDKVCYKLLISFYIKKKSQNYNVTKSLIKEVFWGGGRWGQSDLVSGAHL